MVSVENAHESVKLLIAMVRHLHLVGSGAWVKKLLSGSEKHSSLVPRDLLALTSMTSTRASGSVRSHFLDILCSTARIGTPSALVT